MARFDKCLSFILEREGGYVNDPTDRGGATNKGITQKAYDSYRTSIGIYTRPVIDITSDEVYAIYKLNYWNQAKCPVLNEPLDLMTFDSAVQHGPKRAVRMLQKALGVGDDGLFGPVSFQALQEEYSAGRVKELVDEVLAVRREFYKNIIDNDPTQKRFEKGWENRLKALKEAVS